MKLPRLSDEVIEHLSEMAVVGFKKGDPYLPWLRAYTDLVIAELEFLAQQECPAERS
jgi:hypothetical protein